MTVPNIPLVGQRLETLEGFRGTIKYHGVLPPPPPGSDEPTKGPVWLGVEWDDPTRGKHSGDYKGIQVFTTRIPGSASFVRTDSSKTRFQRQFLKALAERYLPHEADLAMVLQVALGRSSGQASGPANSQGSQVIDGVIQQSTSAAAAMDSTGGVAATVEKSVTVKLGNSNGVDVEMVGWEKVSSKQMQLWRLREIGLGGREIGLTGEEEPGVIAALCPSVTDIDLSRNLFSRWMEVGVICQELKNLDTLRLNHNHFWWWSERSLASTINFPMNFDPFAAIPVSAFANIKVLALNYTGIPWEEIEVAVAPNFPCLEELHLGFNNLKSVKTTATQSILPQLRLLNLESNLISSWSDISSLLPRLQSVTTIHIPHNAVTVIPSTSESFPNITGINLTENQIDNWSSIHALNIIFPNLTKLHFRGNPLTANTERRVDLLFELIARVASVTMVNGSATSAKDRRDAEVWYLNRCATERDTIMRGVGPTEDGPTSTEQLQAFYARHPRYNALVEVHGEPTVAPLSVTSTALKDRMLEVNLISILLSPNPPPSLDTSTYPPSVLSYLPNGGPGAKPAVLKQVTKRVPMTMSMRTLKALMLRLLLPASHRGATVVALHALETAKEGKGSPPPFNVDDELRDVGFFDLSNGDTIRMVLTD
ncbi:hypothetical protein HDU97_001571 [Phlyctochytrium planicorne]|nr:hypothetical protein HDU97_001571 [Phlyctochytrium planicorne]